MDHPTVKLFDDKHK